MKTKISIVLALALVGHCLADNRPDCIQPPLCQNDKGQAANSVQDYAQIADNAYKTDKNALSQTWQCPESQSENLPPLPMAINNSDGLYAQVFVSNGEYVLAFRGSEQTLNDWANNLQQGMTGNSPQYIDARTYAMQVKDMVAACGGPDAKVTIVGHSLGGGLAESAGLATGFPVVAFNPASLGKYEGRAADEAKGYCINKYVNSGDILNNVANPISDAIGLMEGSTAGTKEIGNMVTIANPSWQRSALNFNGKITVQQENAFVALSKALSNFNNASGLSNVSTLTTLVQEFTKDWPQTRQLLDEMGKQWLSPADYATYEKNLNNLESDFAKLAKDLASQSPLIVYMIQLGSDVANIKSHWKILDSELQLSAMAANHGMASMMTLLANQCSQGSGLPPSTSPGNGNSGNAGSGNNGQNGNSGNGNSGSGQAGQNNGPGNSGSGNNNSGGNGSSQQSGPGYQRDPNYKILSK